MARVSYETQALQEVLRNSYQRVDNLQDRKKYYDLIMDIFAMDYNKESYYQVIVFLFEVMADMLDYKKQYNDLHDDYIEFLQGNINMEV